MSSHLPALHHGRHVAAALSQGGTAEPTARRTLHQRRPRLERVTCLSYGAGLLAAAGDRVCCVWDTTTHQLLRRFVTAESITALWMGHDRASLAVAAGSSVAVYDVATGTRRFEYAHGAALASVHVDGFADMLASADQSGCVEVRDLAGGRLVQRVRCEPGCPIVFLYRGRYLLIGARTHSAIIDATTGETLRRFPYDPDERPPLSGTLLDSTLVAYSGSIVRWFDCAAHAPAHCVRDLGSTICSIDIHQGAGLALAATEAGALHIYQLASGAERARYQSFTTPVQFAKFGAGASLYVAGGEALVMHIVDGRHTRSYCDETPPLVAMAVRPQRDALLLTNRDGGVVQIGLRDGQRHGSFAGHAGSVSVVACGNEVVASGAYDGTVRLLDARLRPTATIDLAQGPVQSIALDPVARRAWAGTWSGTVHCVDLDTHQVSVTVRAFSSSVRTLAVDATGERLCAGGDNGEVCVLDLRNGMARVFECRQPGSTYRACFDGDGCLWTAADDGVRRYGVVLTQQVVYPGETIRWFELDGRKLYSLSLSGTLCAFDVVSGEELHRVVIESPVNHRSVAVLSSDRIATASADGIVRVFDAQLRLVASLEVLRDGYLWITSPLDAHPGWLYTDCPHLIDVGECSTAGLEVFTELDPRRTRHLAVFQSQTHVMQIVGGAGAISNSAGSRLAWSSSLGSSTNRLRWTSASANGEFPALGSTTAELP